MSLRVLCLIALIAIATSSLFVTVVPEAQTKLLVVQLTSGTGALLLASQISVSSWRTKK